MTEKPFNLEESLDKLRQPIKAEIILKHIETLKPRDPQPKKSRHKRYKNFIKHPDLFKKI